MLEEHSKNIFERVVKGFEGIPILSSPFCSHEAYMFLIPSPGRPGSATSLKASQPQFLSTIFSDLYSQFMINYP